MPPRPRKMAARRPTIASGRPKRPPRRSGRLYRFPGALRGFQDGPWKATKAVNTAQCASKTAEDRSKTAQDGLRWPQKCSQMPPKTTSLREDPQAPRERRSEFALNMLRIDFLFPIPPRKSTEAATRTTRPTTDCPNTAQNLPERPPDSHSRRYAHEDGPKRTHCGSPRHPRCPRCLRRQPRQVSKIA